MVRTKEEKFIQEVMEAVKTKTEKIILDYRITLHMDDEVVIAEKGLTHVTFNAKTFHYVYLLPKKGDTYLKALIKYLDEKIAQQEK